MGYYRPYGEFDNPPLSRNISRLCSSITVDKEYWCKEEPGFQEWYRNQQEIARKKKKDEASKIPSVWDRHEIQTASNQFIEPKPPIEIKEDKDVYTTISKPDDKNILIRHDFKSDVDWLEMIRQTVDEINELPSFAGILSIEFYCRFGIKVTISYGISPALYERDVLISHFSETNNEVINPKIMSDEELHEAAKKMSRCSFQKMEEEIYYRKIYNLNQLAQTHH